MRHRIFYVLLFSFILTALRTTVYAHESPARNASIGLGQQSREIASGQNTSFTLGLVATGYEFQGEIEHIQRDYDFTNYVVKIMKNEKKVFETKVTPQDKINAKFDYNFKYGGDYEMQVSYNNKNELLIIDTFILKVTGPEESIFSNLLLPIVAGAGIAVVLVGFVVYKRKKTHTSE
jgi:hypothetical protein